MGHVSGVVGRWLYLCEGRLQVVVSAHAAAYAQHLGVERCRLVVAVAHAAPAPVVVKHAEGIVAVAHEGMSALYALAKVQYGASLVELGA